MTSVSNLTRSLVALLGCAALLAATGCSGLRDRVMNVEVVVFNYNPRPIAELTVQGRYVGGFYGGYGPGGTGGGSVCCIQIEPGLAEVRWKISGRIDEPPPPEGWNRTDSGVIPKPASGKEKYLGVHINPDSTVEFTLSRDYPLEKKYGRSP